MTPASAAAGLAAALLFSCAARFTGRLWGLVWSAAGIAVGLAAVTASSPADLVRVVCPREARDWLPAATLLAAAAGIAAQPWREYAIGLLAIGLPVRLLWGSVYLRAGEVTPAVVAAIAAWAVVIFTTWRLTRREGRGRPDTLLWLAGGGAVAFCLAGSGSFSYGAAAGTFPAAAAGLLLVGRPLPPASVVPLVALGGLGVGYAELSWLTAATLATGLVATAGSSHAGDRRVRVATVATAVLCFVAAAAVTGVELSRELSAPASPYDAYR